jgi:hypothetical protein
MVSRPTRGTSLRFTTSSVSRRTVQQQGRFSRSRPFVKRPFQAALLKALVGQPYRLRRQGDVSRYLPDGLTFGQLAQGQGSQHGSHRLQTALQ